MIERAKILDGDLANERQGKEAKASKIEIRWLAAN
jgi:hypothetical protein